MDNSKLPLHTDIFPIICEGAQEKGPIALECQN